MSKSESNILISEFFALSRGTCDDTVSDHTNCQITQGYSDWQQLVNWSTLASATSHYAILIVVRLSVSAILHKHITVGNFQSFWNDAERLRKENKNGLLTMNPKASAQ